MHPKDDAMKTRVCGRSLFVWGLSAALFSLPLAAENAWGGVRTANPQEVQQTRNVTGQVLDENGEPMIGVSVLVKGTQVGAITDFDGNFKLNAPDGAKELQLTYMGYKAQTVKITSGQMSVRYQPAGIIPGDASPFLHSINQNSQIILYAMGILNSKVTASIIEVLSPTLNFEVGNISEIPVVCNEESIHDVVTNVKDCIDLSKPDWDSYETSWDFKKHPLI